jgi:dephospho-CoA kinase
MIIGITGPTGSGKTTLLQLIAAQGGLVLDCDAIYHQLLRTDPSLLSAIEARFPGTVRQNSLDRKALGAIVFADPAALADLNAIAHRYVVEAIRKELEQAKADGVPCAAIDAIALFESGLDRLCHATLAITAPPEIRVRRIMAREGISEEYARSRVAAQNADDFFTSRCQYTLINDCTAPEEFAARAKVLFEDILKTNKA